MTARPIVHFEIHGKDGKRLREFYQALFDWKIEEMPQMNYALVQPGIGGPEQGVGGGIAQSEAPMVTVYVQVIDPAETLKQAERMGGQAVMAPMDVPGGPTIAQFRDPEGNLIGLIKQ